MIKKIIGTVFLLFISLCAFQANAWVAAGGYHGGYNHGYHGNYYHGGYYGNYYGNGWAAPGVVIGVPAGAYYGNGCSLVQKCYPNGGCTNHRICE